MANFNIVYQKDTAAQVIAALPSDVQIITHLEKLRVLTVEALTDAGLLEISGVISVAIDEQIIAETATTPWHKLRICSAALPMRDQYLSKNTGVNTTVYMVDSGVNVVGDLANATIENLYSFDGTFSDTLNHGTGIASLIVGETLGVSKDAKLKVVKIPMNVAVNVSALLTAFDSILTDHAVTPGVKIVNCSWVVPKNQILDLKIQELQSEGLLVVAAAGNSISNADNFSPVGLDTVLGVAASDAFDRVINWGTGAGSNWGTEVDITAPGIDVEVLSNDGTTVTTSGTSIAAAIVSGAVAQFIVEHPTKTAQEIQDLIIATSSQDLLFRNESVYGTTPNMLLRVPQFQFVFEGTPTSVNVQKGTSVNIQVVTHPVVSSVSIDDIIIAGKPSPAFSWVALDTQTNQLTLTPTADVTSAKYVIRISAKNSNNDVIMNFGIIASVFSDSVTEITGTETYFLTETNGVVTVRPSYCISEGQYCEFSSCFDDGKGGGCECVNNSCQSQF